MSIPLQFVKLKLCRLLVSPLVHSKDDCEISVSFKQIQNFEVSNLAMVKVKKVNITVTFLFMLLGAHLRLPRHHGTDAGGGSTLHDGRQSVNLIKSFCSSPMKRTNKIESLSLSSLSGLD